MQVERKFDKLCAASVQMGGGPGTPTTLFSIDLTTWTPEGTDPTSGGTLVLTCKTQLNCYDTISGLTYWIGHFRILRFGATGGFIYYTSSTTGLTIDIGGSGSVVTLRLNETVGHLTLVDGVIHIEAHY